MLCSEPNIFQQPVVQLQSVTLFREAGQIIATLTVHKREGTEHHPTWEYFPQCELLSSSFTLQCPPPFGLTLNPVLIQAT